MNNVARRGSQDSYSACDCASPVIQTLARKHGTLVHRL